MRKLFLAVGVILVGLLLNPMAALAQQKEPDETNSFAF